MPRWTPSWGPCGRSTTSGSWPWASGRPASSRPTPASSGTRRTSPGAMCPWRRWSSPPWTCPSVVDNDCSAAAYGEYRLGAARGHRHVLYVGVGTGIGGGIVVDGRIDRGAHGFAGEIGHMIVERDGPRCGCGNDGCWETVASGSALAREGRAAALLDASSRGSCRRRPRGRDRRARRAGGAGGRRRGGGRRRARRAAPRRGDRRAREHLRSGDRRGRRRRRARRGRAAPSGSGGRRGNRRGRARTGRTSRSSLRRSGRMPPRSAPA